MRIQTYSLLFILGIIVIVAVSGCSSQNQTNKSGDSYNIGIQNFAFNPSTLTVPVDTTVTWKNLDSTTHHIVSDTGLFESTDLSNGQTFSYSFTQAGNYPYHCSIHPSMTGTIVVTSAPTTSNQAQNPSQSNQSIPGGMGGMPGY